MPVHCFGRQVTCVHCGGEFRADDQARATMLPAGLLPEGADFTELAEQLAALPQAAGSPRFETR
jgi:hypothetical protein